MTAFIRRNAQRFGLDDKVLSGLFNKIISMALGPIGSALVVLKLDINSQGIYYLFLSILAMRTFFELGINMSISQIAAHEKYAVKGKDVVTASYVKATSEWMLKASFFFSIFVGFGGASFLIYKGYSTPHILCAWGIFIFVSSYQFSQDHQWSILMGADYVKECNNLRAKLQLLLYGAQWTLLLLGGGLFSFAISSLLSVIAQKVFLRKKFPWLFPKNADFNRQDVIVQKVQLRNLLKKTGQTFLTGFFVFEIQQPICFHFLGAEGSARLGFTQMIGIALISIPHIWLQSGFPKVASLVAHNEKHAAWKKFRSTWIQTSILIGFSLFLAIFAVEILRNFPRFCERLLSTSETIVLFSALALQNLALAMTYWPRAFKSEPYVIIAYIQMFATPLLLWLLAANFGMIGMGVAAICTWLIGAIGIWVSTSPYFPWGKKFDSVLA